MSVANVPPLPPVEELLKHAETISPQWARDFRRLQRDHGHQGPGYFLFLRARFETDSEFDAHMRDQMNGVVGLENYRKSDLSAAIKQRVEQGDTGVPLLPENLPLNVAVAFDLMRTLQGFGLQGFPQNGNSYQLMQLARAFILPENIAAPAAPQDKNKPAASEGVTLKRHFNSAFMNPLDYYMRSELGLEGTASAMDEQFAAMLADQDAQGDAAAWLKRINDFRINDEPPLNKRTMAYTPLALSLADRLNMDVGVLFPIEFFNGTRRPSDYFHHWKILSARRKADKVTFIKTIEAAPSPNTETSPDGVIEAAALDAEAPSPDAAPAKKQRGKKNFDPRIGESLSRADELLAAAKKPTAKQLRNAEREAQLAALAAAEEIALKNQGAAAKPDVPKPGAMNPARAAVLAGNALFSVSAPSDFPNSPVPSVAAALTKAKPRGEEYTPGILSAKARALGVVPKDFSGPWEILKGSAQFDQNVDRDGKPGANIRALAALVVGKADADAIDDHAQSIADEWAVRAGRAPQKPGASPVRKAMSAAKTPKAGS